MSAPNIFDRVRQDWTETGVDLLPPCEEAEIVNVFSRGGQLPVSQDVIRLYRTVGGFRDWSIDADANLSLWPLEKVHEDNAGYDGPEICFGDFLIGSHYFYIRFESADHSCLLGGRHSPEVHAEFQGFGDEPMFCCPSIAEFFDGYLQDPFAACHGMT
jgi:hypothetical protein